MRYLDNCELMDISGGGFSPAVVAGIGAGLAFVIGILDGLVRPLRCR